MRTISEMSEMMTIETTSHVIDTIYKAKSIDYKKVSMRHDDDELYTGRYVVLKSGQQSALCCCDYDSERFELIETKDVAYHGVKALDARQRCMLYGLKRFPLFVALGGAGTGKTTLSIAYSLHMMFREEKNIVLCKPTTFVGQKSNAIAAIPGDHREKMAGYIDSFLVALKRILGDHAEHHLYEMEEKQRIVFKPLELLRGMHFDNAVVIIDEAQNTTPHELMTLMSRVDDTAQLIVMGDPLQIDTGLRFNETGLGVLLESDTFLDSEYSSSVTLTAQYRGVLADLAIDLLKEMNAKRDALEDDVDLDDLKPQKTHGNL